MGHIQTRERGGKKRYVVRYTGTDGKERTKTFDKLGRTDTPDTAKHFLSKVEAQLRDHEWIDPDRAKITVTQYARQWQDRARADNTKRLRGQFVKNVGPLAEMYLTQVQPADVRHWVDLLLGGRPWAGGKPLSARTAEMYLQSLSGLLAIAVDDGLIRKNPCRKIRVQRQDITAPSFDEIPTAAQVFAVAECARAPLGHMIVLTAATGLRPSEVAGLRVSDVDFLRREIAVKVQASANPNRPPQPLKTGASKRTVPLPQVAAERLSAYLATVDRRRDEPIFRTRRGGIWCVSYMAHQFAAVSTRAGVRGFTWHDLRHFYASALIQSGASVKTVQARLGHTSATVTLTVYAHLWPGEDDRTRDAMDAVLSRVGAERRDHDGTVGYGVGMETYAEQGR